MSTGCLLVETMTTWASATCLCGVFLCVCACMCEKNIYVQTNAFMCSETCTHVHGHVFSSALLRDFYVSAPRAAGRIAHINMYALQLERCSGRRAPRAGGSRTGRVTRVRRNGVTRVKRRWRELHVFASFLLATFSLQLHGAFQEGCHGARCIAHAWT